MSNKPVAEKLRYVLADTYSLYLKTQSYHWNVEGGNFSQLHAMFQDQYTDLATAIDDTAEHIRALGEKVSAGFERFKKITIIKDGDETLCSAAMVEDLASDQEKITETLQATFDIAEKSKDQVVMDFMIQRMAVHRKNKWMLESSLPR